MHFLGAAAVGPLVAESLVCSDSARYTVARLTVTEYLDHYQPVRGARTAGAAADTRALRALTPGSGADTLKLDAFRMLQPA